MKDVNDPIRDPDKLDPTKHLHQQMKDRNIGWRQIEMAIEDGSTEPGSKPTDIKYRLDMPGVDLLVVVDPREMNVTTAFYDDDQGASRGRL